MKGPSLLLTSIIALAMAAPALALESMDDDSLSQLVAQDGATWTMDMSQTMDAYRIVDKDGYTGVTNPGQVIIKNMGLKTCTETTSLGTCTATTGGAGMTIRFDAGSQAAGANPVLLATITTARKIRQQMEGLWIGNVDSASPSKQPLASGSYQILSVNPGGALADKYVDITTPVGNVLRMEMGNQPSGNFLTAQSLKISKIEMNGGMALCDASAVGCANALRIGGYKIEGVGGTDVDLSGTVMGVNSSGLYLTMGPNVKMDLYNTNQSLGASTNPGMGSVVMRGLDLSGATLTMSGH